MEDQAAGSGKRGQQQQHQPHEARAEYHQQQQT